MERLLEHALGRNRWLNAKHEMKTRAAAVHEGAGWVKRLQGAHELLRKEPLEITPGVRVAVGDLVNPDCVAVAVTVRSNGFRWSSRSCATGPS